MSRGICYWCKKPHNMEPYRAWCSEECGEAYYNDWLTNRSKFDIINNRERDNPAYMEYDT